MAVITKLIATQDIVNGASVVNPSLAGSGYMYDNPARTQHLASGDALTFFQELDSRYRYHSGVGGSGNWEH